MADPARIESLAGSLDAPLRRVFKDVGQYILRELRFGRAENNKQAENLRNYFYHVTTPATANQEFEIEHGLGQIPYLLQQVLPLDQVGKKMVRLEVSRAADARRIYLKSPDVSAPIVVMVEG